MATRQTLSQSTKELIVEARINCKQKIIENLDKIIILKNRIINLQNTQINRKKHYLNTTYLKGANWNYNITDWIFHSINWGSLSIFFIFIIFEKTKDIKMFGWLVETFFALFITNWIWSLFCSKLITKHNQYTIDKGDYKVRLK